MEGIQKWMSKLQACLQALSFMFGVVDDNLIEHSDSQKLRVNYGQSCVWVGLISLLCPLQFLTYIELGGGKGS